MRNTQEIDNCQMNMKEKNEIKKEKKNLMIYW